MTRALLVLCVLVLFLALTWQGQAQTQPKATPTPTWERVVKPTLTPLARLWFPLVFDQRRNAGPKE